MQEFTGLRWIKSSASGANGCVEVAHMPSGEIALRDSKDRAKTPHLFDRNEWAAFLTGVRNGEFDLPA